MRLFRTTLAIPLLAVTLASLAAANHGVAPMAKNLGADVEKREAVKQAFLYNYDNYEKYA